MLRFFPLLISDVRAETPSAVSVAFQVPPRWKRMYQFKPGQYLILRVRLGDREVRRPYSVCSGILDAELRIAIKRIDGGQFSKYALEQLRPGQTIEVMPPHGQFFVALEPKAARSYVLCATGSGITPILSIMKSVLSTELESRVALFYGNRSVDEIMFRDEIDKLSDQFGQRLSVFHFLSRQSAGAPFVSGRLDERVIALAEQTFVDLATVDACFMCGAAEMTSALTTQFRQRGLLPDRIHVELFKGSSGPLPHGVIRDANAVLIVGGERHNLRLGDATVLDAALEAGVELPYACRMGSCSSCECRLLEGRVHMALNNALDEKRVGAGFVLTCQARALTPQIILDCDGS